MNFADSSKYTGEFFDNFIQGNGIFKWTDGRIYNGQWLRNKMHGNGKLCWKDGRTYDGQFENDKKHGKKVFSIMTSCIIQNNFIFSIIL